MLNTRTLAFAAAMSLAAAAISGCSRTSDGTVVMDTPSASAFFKPVWLRFRPEPEPDYRPAPGPAPAYLPPQPAVYKPRRAAPMSGVHIGREASLKCLRETDSAGRVRMVCR